MKNVHIITRHFIPNYGSLLQSLSSIKIFEDLGYAPTIIDYVAKTETLLPQNTHFARKFTKNPILGTVFWIAKLPDQIVKRARFHSLRKKYLKMTKRLSSSKELREYDFSDSYFCSGSDQLWGYVSDEKTVDSNYFLDFTKEGDVCFAYSSSFGRTDFSSEQLANLTELLKKFSFITVREQSGVELIANHTPYSAEHVLDPTLTVDPKFWQDFANVTIKGKPYLLIYHLRRNKMLERYAKNLAKENGWKIIRVSTSIYDLFKQGKCKLLADPKKVLSLFKNAQCVVTDSFHATVFSLIFNKPFIDVLPPTTHERITDLLSLVGLPERAFAHDGDVPLDIATAPIDYEKVNSILEKVRNESLQTLSKNLEKLEN